MNFLSDRLDKRLFKDPDELAFIEAHIGFDKLTLKQAQEALRKAQQAEEDDDDVDLSGVIKQLEEIIDDRRFMEDPKNAIVAWIHDHHQELEAAVREHYAVEGLMVRAHADLGYLMIMGQATTPLDGIEQMVKRISGFEAKNRVRVNGERPGDS